MTITGKKVGIVSDEPLHKNTLGKAVEEIGLTVALNTSPDRVSSEEIADETIAAWIIDLADEDRWSDFLDEMLDTVTVPLLFGEGEVPPFNSDEFIRWQRRFNKKVRSVLTPVDNISIPELEIPEVQRVQESAEDATSDVPLMSSIKSDIKQRISLPSNIKNPLKKGEPAPYVWVIGASLGGPGAVKRFLDVLPEGLPIGFVYAQHIDNNFLPVLNQVLGRHSVFDMRQCSHRKKVGVGEVHIVPVNHQIRCTKEEGVIFVHNRPWQGLYSPSISHVMKEFAQCYGPDTGAIIFSGMGDDASDGTVAMADSGADVWVQKLSTCASASMPESVLATGKSNFQATPEELAEKLVQIIASKYQDAVIVDEHSGDVSIDDPIYPF